MPIEHLATRNDIIHWADQVESRTEFPALIRGLIWATSNPDFIHFPAQEGGGQPGWDGRVEISAGTTYVPIGYSGWELGTGVDPADKANDDYNSRTENPDPLDPSQSTFVFCTPRAWSRKDAWVARRQQERVWRQVLAYNVDDLLTWLEMAPGVHVRLSLQIGKPVASVKDLHSWWDAWRHVTDPPLFAEFLLSGRSEAAQILIDHIREDPRVVKVRGESSSEALAFIGAAIQIQPPEVGGALGSRALIIDNQEAWHYYSAQDRPLILIPRFYDAALGIEAANKGHHVIVPTSGASGHSEDLNLPRLSVGEAINVLEDRGIPSTQARHMAGLARRSISAYRRVHSVVAPEAPEWAQTDHAISLIPLILAGEWDEAYEGDREVVERLAGRAYDDIRGDLVRWQYHEDALFRQVGSRWSVNAKEDSWRILAVYASEEVVSRFVDTAVEVLRDRAPKRRLSFQERPFSAWHGIHRPHSAHLRQGLADSIAMLGALGGPELGIAIAEGTQTSGFAVRAVRQLLGGAVENRETWLDLADHLPALAEASPDWFCDVLESDLRSQNPTVLILFEPEPGFFTPNYSYPSLLWALEKLAWSEISFPRAALLTAHLASIVPETSTLNSPLDTLVSFFRLWLPQCNASLETRLEVTDQIRQQFVEVSWELLMGLLPSSRDIANMSSGPGARAVLWRDWPSEAIRPTLGEFRRAASEIAQRLLEDANHQPERWPSIIERLNDLPDQYRERALEQLDEFVGDLEDTDLRSQIWNNLRNEITKHRSFKNADWALDEETISRFEGIRERLAPEEFSTRYLWLFTHHPNLDVSIEDHREELERQQLSAVREIMIQGGLEAVFDFAERCEVSNGVGVALFAMQLNREETLEVIGGFGVSEKRWSVASGYIWKAQLELGQAWVQQFFDAATLIPWEESTRAAVLRCLQVSTDTLDLVDTQSKNTRRLFWEDFNVFSGFVPELAERIMAGLIGVGRAHSAIHVLAIHVERKRVSINLMTAYQAVCASIEEATINSDLHLRSSDVRRLLHFLRNNIDTLEDDLERLEWDCLPHLDSDAGGLRLHEKLSENPGFFVEMVDLAFPKDSELEEGGSEPVQARWRQGLRGVRKIVERFLQIDQTDDLENRRRAHKLLRSWTTPPGCRSDRSIDEDRLTEWMTQVKPALEDREITVGGHTAIGRVLRWGPAERDGVWPDPAICNVIQDLASDRLDEAFELEVFNNRGVTSRDPFSGGEQERDLVKQYGDYAQKLQVHWPRVAKILRNLADTYRGIATRHDQEAELREDELG